MCDKARIQRAIGIAMSYGGFDGGHHKMWTIDQMVRALTGCLEVKGTSIGYGGEPYAHTETHLSDEYLRLIADFCDGEDGPDTYEWDVGVAP